MNRHPRNPRPISGPQAKKPHHQPSQAAPKQKEPASNPDMTSLDLEIRRQLLAPHLPPQAVEGMWHNLEQAMNPGPTRKEKPMFYAPNSEAVRPARRPLNLTKILAGIAAVLVLAIIGLRFLPPILNQGGPNLQQVPYKGGPQGMLPGAVSDQDKETQDAEDQDQNVSSSEHDLAAMDFQDPTLPLPPFYLPYGVQNLGLYAAASPESFSSPLPNLYWGPGCRLPVYQNKYLAQITPEDPYPLKIRPALIISDEEIAQALQDYATDHGLEMQEVSYLPSLEDQAANRQAYLDQGVDPDTDMNVVMEGGVKTEVAYALTNDGALAFVRGFYGGTIYHLYAEPELSPEGLEFPSLYRPAEQSPEQIDLLKTWFVEADPTVLGQMENPQYVYSKQYDYVGVPSLRTSLYFDKSDNPNQAAVNLALKSVAPLSQSLESWVDEIWPGYSDKYLVWTDEGKPQANYFLGTSTAWQGAYEKIGDYPIISPEEAKARFLAGQASRELYQEFISAEEAAKLNVVATELVYPNTLPAPATKIIQPFYRLVVQDEQLKNVDTQEPLFTEDGDPIYGYYFVMVPAVADEWVDWDYQPQYVFDHEDIANTETFPAP